jgi:hypothetical protein
MKRIGMIILLIAITMYGFSLKVTAEGQEGDKKANDSKKAVSSSDTALKEQTNIEDHDSVQKLKNGDRRLDILESLEGPTLNIRNYPVKNDWDADDNDHEHERRGNRFKGHWSGIELGFNNWVTSDRNMALPSNIDYMTLNSGKSTNFNLNFAQLSLGLSRHVGFITGLGLNWNNYRFDGNNNIIKGDNGVIDVLDPGSNLDKSKLTTLFLTVPFLLECQLHVDHNNLSIAAGPIGAIKLGSHTKMVFENGHTVKSYGDFSLNMLRYGATARVGYGNFQLYGTYYGTPLFETGKGPAGIDLYPFEVGVALTFNN